MIAARRKRESENKKTSTENRMWDGENEQQRGRLVDRSSVEREETHAKRKRKVGHSCLTFYEARHESLLYERRCKHRSKLDTTNDMKIGGTCQRHAA